MTRAILLAGLVGIMGCAGGSPTVAVKAEPEPVRPKAPVPKPKPKPPEPEPEPEPEPKKPPTFEETWAEACKLLDARAAEEPAKTAKALKLLNVGERQDAENRARLARSNVGNDVSPHPETIRLLDGYGLSDQLRVITAGAARQNAPFKDVVARTLWHAQMSPAELAAMIETWYLLRQDFRQRTLSVMKAKTPVTAIEPPVRDAILSLGGEKWLTR